MSHFGASLKDKIGKVILGAATPPGTVEEMLLAAEAVEAELAKVGQQGQGLSSGSTGRSGSNPRSGSDVRSC